MFFKYLVLKLWEKVEILEQLHDDCITKAKAGAGLLLAAKGLQQLVIAPSPGNGPQLPFPVPCLKHNPCIAATLFARTHVDCKRQAAAMVLHCKVLSAFLAQHVTRYSTGNGCLCSYQCRYMVPVFTSWISNTYSTCQPST